MKLVIKMKEITKNNLQEFLEYYHYLHDSTISNINSDIYNSKIEMFIDIYWSGEPVLKDDKTYETNKTKMLIVFEGIERYNSKEFYSWNYINDIYFKYIMLKNKEYLCFSNEEEYPYIYIVCNKIFYEEQNK